MAAAHGLRPPRQQKEVGLAVADHLERRRLVRGRVEEGRLGGGGDGEDGGGAEEGGGQEGGAGVVEP